MDMAHNIIAGSFWVGISNLILVLVTLFILVLNLYDYFRSPAAGAFAYYIFGTMLVGMFRVFLVLVSAGVLRISESTAIVGWHLVFYVAMLLYLNAAISLLRAVAGSMLSSKAFTTILLMGNLAVLAAATLLTATVFANEWVTRVFDGSLLDRSGALHFVAFALGAAVVTYTFRARRRLPADVASVALPIIISIFFLSAVHLWELLNESWHVIMVSDELGEAVEEFLNLPAIVSLLVAFLRSRILMKHVSAEEEFKEYVS